MSLVTPSLTYWPNPNTGKPLFNGYVYVGEPDTDPEIALNQKQVTLRLEDGTTLEVGQPLRLSEGGVLQYNGNYAVITVEGDYSVKALDRRESQAFYIPNNSGIFDASQISITINDVKTNVGSYIVENNFASFSDMIAADIEPTRVVRTIGYYSIGDEGGAEYEIKTLSQHRIDIGAPTWVPDGYLNAYSGSGTTNVAIFTSEFAYPEQFGLRHSTHSSPSNSCQTVFNEVIKNVKIKIKGGRLYNIDGAVVISADYQSIEGELQSELSGFIINDDDYRGNGVQTINFPNTALNRCTLVNILVKGNRNSFTTTEVKAASGDEGIGIALTLGNSELRVYTQYTLGVGILFSNGGDFNLYTAVNYIYAVSAFSGQEGVVYDGYVDARVKYTESYFAWDSDRDTDYTSTKVSKATSAPICAGVLFRAGSCEVQEMHPNNNRHGYAWATYGVSGRSFRLRFATAIGEGSAAAVYIAAVDDVTGALLNCHSTRGKYGLSLARIESLNNVQISALNVKVDEQSGYPAADGGTYRALEIVGDRIVLDSVRVWKSGTGSCYDSVVRIEGEGHKVSGSISGLSTNEDSVYVPAITVGPSTQLCDVDFKIFGSGVGFSGSSSATNPGVFNLTFAEMQSDDVNSTFLGFLSSQFMQQSYLINQSTGVSTKDKTLFSGTISSSEADGSNKTVSIPWGGKFYKTPTVKSVTVRNMGSSTYNASGIDVWVSAVTTTDIVIKYNIDSYSGDFEIVCNCGH